MKKVIIPSGIADSEFVVKKSRFISLVFPVQNDSEVRLHLKALRKDHPGANHVVWSYVLGDAGTMHGLSDDGEPHGTAGRPVLEVLKGSGMTYIALFVIRYFGGTKLGTGGLVSAYTMAAQKVLKLVEPCEKVDYCQVDLKCSYSQYERIRHFLEEYGIRELTEEFTDSVFLKGELPGEYLECCRNEISEYSNGQAILNDIPD